MDRLERPRFLAGIVEGFYGRPWTPNQRKDLFRRMKDDFAMDCYMYAPKDDYKHRSSWRELYTASECDQLRRLLLEAKNHRIEFFYSLSPGLDMVYSSERDRQFLKAKYEQVAQLGCSKFAILFDDIEPQLQPSDRRVYQSFAEAHVSVANEIYEHRGRPRFLFCPTEYCGTRAVPSVKDSEYLNSIGLNLHEEIDIMWTGPQVISKTISVESLLELGKVLRRKPVIWDNLHANDYDQRRLFLGPYNRDGKMISCINGIFTNPNCEFESNFNAFYTLGCWLRSALSTLGSGEICDELANYDPRAALCKSIKEWLKEFCVRRRPDDYSSVTAGSTVPPAEALSKSNDINLVNTLAGTILTDKDSTLKSADCQEGDNVGGGKSKQIMESEPMDFVTDSPQHFRPESREETGDVLEVKQSSAVGKNEIDPEPVLDTVMRSVGGEEVSNAEDNGRRKQDYDYKGKPTSGRS